jgi:hypothetical protein
MTKTMAALILALFAMTFGVAYADSIGTNITVFDHNRAAGYDGIGIGLEDNETEANPATIQQQVWDLEGFFLDGNNLSMVGGYNFIAGVEHSGHVYTPGDIFIDTTGDAKYGIKANPENPNNGGWPNGTPSWNGTNQYGWDYAIRLNADSTYTVWKIDSDTLVSKVTDVPSSNPWKLADTSSLQIIGSGTFQFSSTTENPFEGLQSWDTDTHYIVTGIDVGFLGHAQPFTAHYTYECGNDSMIGQGTTQAPEPGTLILLGLGLAVLAGGKRLACKK